MGPWSLRIKKNWEGNNSIEMVIKAVQFNHNLEIISINANWCTEIYSSKNNQGP